MIRYRKSAVCLAVATGLLTRSGFAQEAPSTARGGVRIEVTFSRQLALLDFMKKLRPSAPNNPFETLFANSAYTNGPLAGLTGALDSIPLDYEYPFTQKYRYRNHATYLRAFSPESLARLREAPTTRLVIVSRDNRKTLALVQAAIPELAGWRPDAHVILRTR